MLHLADEARALNVYPSALVSRITAATNETCNVSLFGLPVFVRHRYAALSAGFLRCWE
jgi:hypothetical protein